MWPGRAVNCGRRGPRVHRGPVDVRAAVGGDVEVAGDQARRGHAGRRAGVVADRGDVERQAARHGRKRRRSCCRGAACPSPTTRSRCPCPPRRRRRPGWRRGSARTSRSGAVSGERPATRYVASVPGTSCSETGAVSRFVPPLSVSDRCPAGPGSGRSGRRRSRSRSRSASWSAWFPTGRTDVHPDRRQHGERLTGCEVTTWPDPVVDPDAHRVGRRRWPGCPGPGAGPR